LLPVERAGRGYKRYTEWHVVRLLQIKYAKAAGFTLAQIRELLDQWVSGQLSPAEKQIILAEQVEKIDQALVELHIVRRYLQEKVAAEAAGQTVGDAVRLHHTPHRAELIK
jgi:DNA-binding transcriptional MerR regulator